MSTRSKPLARRRYCSVSGWLGRTCVRSRMEVVEDARSRRHVREGIGVRGLETALAGDGYHLAIGVDTARADAGGLQGRQELAAPAAHVEHIHSPGQNRHPPAPPLPDPV